MSELPEHVARNRRFWNDYAPKWVDAGRDDWAAASRSSGSSSRCCTATPRKCRIRRPPSTSRSPSTGRASGPTRTAGSRRRAGCCALAPSSSFSSTRFWRCFCYPEDENEPPGERLLRPYFGKHRFEWPQDESVEFHLPHGKLIALLRESGFDVEELIEIQPPEGSTTRFPGSDLEWSRRWPLEEA